METPSAIGVNKTAVSAVATLIETVTVLAPATGVISRTVLDGLLTSPFIIPLAIVPPSSKAATFLNHNDIHKAENNQYKQGQALQPNYTLDQVGITLYPTSEAFANTVVTVLREPVAITDMPASVHHKLIAKAMTKTGLVTENQAITMMEGTTNG